MTRELLRTSAFVRAMRRQLKRHPQATLKQRSNCWQKIHVTYGGRRTNLRATWPECGHVVLDTICEFYLTSLSNKAPRQFCYFSWELMTKSIKLDN